MSTPLEGQRPKLVMAPSSRGCLPIYLKQPCCHLCSLKDATSTQGRQPVIQRQSPRADRRRPGQGSRGLTLDICHRNHHLLYCSSCYLVTRFRPDAQARISRAPYCERLTSTEYLAIGIRPCQAPETSRLPVQPSSHPEVRAILGDCPRCHLATRMPSQRPLSPTSRLQHGMRT